MSRLRRILWEWQGILQLISQNGFSLEGVFSFFHCSLLFYDYSKSFCRQTRDRATDWLKIAKWPGVCQGRGVMLKFRFDRGINVRPHEEKFLITGTPSPPTSTQTKETTTVKNIAEQSWDTRSKNQRTDIYQYILESSGGVLVRALTSHKCGPDSISRLGVKCGLNFSVLFSALRGFPPGTTVFPSPQNPACDKIWFVLISIYSVPN